MHRPWRPLALVLVALTFAIAACGVESGDAGPSSTGSSSTDEPGSPTTTAKPNEDLSATEQEAVDQMIATYTELGFTEEEASCLANGMVEEFGTSADPNAGAMDVMNQCDIPMSRVMDIMGGGSLEETMKKSLMASFKSMGLTKKQAECVADAFVDQFGSDASAATDMNAMNDLFKGCDVDPSKIKPGG